jgi:hypothetical protein
MRLHMYLHSAPLWIGDMQGRPYEPFPTYSHFCRAWNTNHISRDNLSMVFMMPWPNLGREGDVMPFLIDNVEGGRNRMWVVAE